MVKDVLPVHRSGYNPNLQNGVEETIWAYSSGDPYYAASPYVISVVSSDAADTSKSVLIEGLDANWNIITETITLNGTTPVTTSNTFMRIINATNISSSAIVGNLSFSQNGGNVIAYIVDGVGKTMLATYTIPANYTGYLYKGDASVGKGGDAEVRMYVRPYGKTWFAGHIAQVYQNQYNYDFPFPTPIPEKSDIKVTAKTSTTGTAIACNFDILLVRNPNT